MEYNSIQVSIPLRIPNSAVEMLLSLSMASVATVNLEGTVDVSGNTFGGIEVCKGSNPDLTAGVLNIGTASIVNTTEAYGQPTIWIDGNTDDVGIVNGAESMTMVEVAHGDTTQKQYYLNAENSHPIIAGSTGYDTLADAITGAAGETIHIKADLNETVSVAAGSTVVIDGEGHKLHGTNQSSVRWIGCNNRIC